MNYQGDGFSRLHPNALLRNERPAKTPYKTERNGYLIRSFAEPSLASYGPLASEREVREQELRHLTEQTLRSLAENVNRFAEYAYHLTKASK